MDKFPQELIIALIFGAVMLVQFLLKHLRKRGPLTEAGSEVEIEAEIRAEPDTVVQRPKAAEVPQPAQALPIFAVPVPVPAPPRAGPAPLRRDARRFSRRSLMGSRRAVQDAIVIAAILGPCRAYQPHGID